MDAPIPTVTLAATWTPKAASPTAPTIAGALHPVRPVSDVLSGEFQRFHRTGDAVWLVSDAGFARLEDGAWRVVVSDVAGTPVGEDAAGRPWVVSPDTEMIAVWERSGWTAYGDDIGGVVFEPGGEGGRDSPVSPSQDR
jgi:hypothetical protein